MKVTVVRCPKCGSTDAGDAGGMWEFARMRCESCGFEDYQDDYQIIDNWNVELELPDDATELPKKLPVKS